MIIYIYLCISRNKKLYQYEFSNIFNHALHEYACKSSL